MKIRRYAIEHTHGKGYRDKLGKPVVILHSFDDADERRKWLNQGPGLSTAKGYREEISADLLKKSKKSKKRALKKEALLSI